MIGSLFPGGDNVMLLALCVPVAILIFFIGIFKINFANRQLL